MRYRSKGRPKIDRATIDLGTPELQNKRREHRTEEVLDRYLRLSLIDTQQHWCGIHLRWLYTKRYGLPTVKSYSYLEKGRLCTLDDPEMVQDFHNEYAFAYHALGNAATRRVVLDVAVFNHDILENKLLLRNIVLNDNYILKNQFINGINILVSLWCR